VLHEPPPQPPEKHDGMPMHGSEQHMDGPQQGEPHDGMQQGPHDGMQQQPMQLTLPQQIGVNALYGTQHSLRQ
jgi:hypothetical protein